MTSESKRHWNALVTVLPTCLLALFMGIGPRHAYARLAELLALVVPVRPGAATDPVDELLFYVACCLVPLVVVDAWRGARVLSMTFVPSLVFYSGIAVPFFMPAALVPLADVFGDGAVVVAFLIWPVATFSVVAFVVAAAQVDAEQQGRQPHTLFLAVLYHFGGFVGVYFVHRLFPESKTCAEMLKTMPRGLAFLAAAVAVCVLLKLL